MKTAAQIKTLEAPELLQILKSAYGVHPETVLCVTTTAINALEQCEALFSTIEEQLERSGSPLIRTKHLAGAGRSIAMDAWNSIDGEHSGIKDSLQNSGVFGGEA